MVKTIKRKMTEEKPYVGRISTDAETRSEGEITLVFLNDKNRKVLQKFFWLKMISIKQFMLFMPENTFE